MLVLLHNNIIIFPLNEKTTEDYFRYSIFNYICSDRLDTDNCNNFSEILDLYELLKNIKWKDVGEILEIQFLDKTYKIGVVI